MFKFKNKIILFICFLACLSVFYFVPIFDETLMYTVLMILTVSFPLIASFESRIFFYKKWFRTLKSIFFMMLIFIPWDILFTYSNVWRFNNKYTIGLDFLYLPIEEWAFFIAVPFSCIFIYEVINYLFPKISSVKRVKKISFIFSFFLMLLSLIFWNNAYTFVCFFFSALALLLLIIKNENLIVPFFRTYFISIIPLLIVNGFLTGSFGEPIVIYNESEIIGLRIMNIPVEDFIYNLFLLLTTLLFYNRFKKTI